MNQTEIDIIALFEDETTKTADSMILSPSMWQRALKNFLSKCLNSAQASVYLGGPEKKDMFIRIIMQNLIFKRHKMLKDAEYEYENTCKDFYDQINSVKQIIESKYATKKEKLKHYVAQVDKIKDLVTTHAQTKDVEKLWTQADHLDDLKKKIGVNVEDTLPLRSKLKHVGEFSDNLKKNEVITQTAVECLIILSREDVGLDSLYLDAKKDVDLTVRQALITNSIDDESV